jgi:hypothetical protein
MQSVTADRVQALDEKRCCKSATRNLVRDVPLGQKVDLLRQPSVLLLRRFRFYDQPLVQVVSHATKRRKRSMQSPPILRTRKKRRFIR